MPKHVGLGMSLKISHCSKEFITLLNKLGDSISYDDDLYIETEWTDTLLEKDDSYTVVPINITSGYSTQASADNSDHVQIPICSTLQTLFCINMVALKIK